MCGDILGLPALNPVFRASTINDQALKIAEETCEVVRATTPAEKAEEVWDVVQACQTLLQMLSEQGVDVYGARARMIAKNRARGRYDGSVAHG